jgi:ADP-heptose:LPS heptosyltransferase
MSRRVIVCRLDSAGDVLLAGPAVRAVAATGAHVTMVVSSQGEPAAELLPGVGEIVVLDAPWVHADAPPVRAADLMRFVLRLRRRRHDEGIILTSAHQSSIPTALLLRLAGTRRICAASHDYPGSLLDVRIDVDEDLHEAQRSAFIAQRSGYQAVGDGLAIIDELPTFDWQGKGPRYVVVHPGADAPARAWDPQNARAAVRVLARSGYQVLVTGGPRETALTAFVAADEGVDLGGRTSLAELATVIKGARAIVVGNTGPAHLAAAVGVPVVSLFAPVVPAHRWQPYGVPLKVLGDQYAPCAGSRARVCPVPEHPCLSTVTAADVVRAVHELAGVAA